MALRFSKVAQGVAHHDGKEVTLRTYAVYDGAELLGHVMRGISFGRLHWPSGAQRQTRRVQMCWLAEGLEFREEFPTREEAAEALAVSRSWGASRRTPALA